MTQLLRAWAGELQEPLPDLAARQKWMLAAVALLAAISRLAAISCSVWDSDEARFTLAIQDFDVADHRPHPPGFPLFVALGRIVHLLGFSEFRSLQVVVVAAAVALAPAMFFLCREARAPFSTSVFASLLVAFLPNVWFYGGTAFSDVPAMTLLVVAIALLLRGCRSLPALYGGAIVLALAASIRPQSLLVGAVAFVLALTTQRRRTRSMPAVLVVLLLLAVSYGMAAHLTGWHRYADALRAHREYIAATDSFRSSIRPPLYFLVDDFFVRPFRAPTINAPLCLLMLLSIITAFPRGRAQPLFFLIAFAPFCLLAWLTLDHFSASRFSIGYAPLMAFLAADGLRVLAGTRPRAEAAGAFVLVGAMIVWTWPSLIEARKNPAPPVRAMNWIRGVSSSRLTVAVDPRLTAHAQLLLKEFRRRDDAPELTSPWRTGERAFFVREEIPRAFQSKRFSRSHNRLWSLARQRYFDVAVIDAGPSVLFLEGWYGEESRGDDVWRWMGRRGVIRLPPASAPARLTLELRIPLDDLHVSPAITVRFNGKTIDSFQAISPVAVRDYALMPREENANELVIETSEVARVGSDPRELGIRLDDVRWSWRRSELEVHRDRKPGLDAFSVFDRR